MKDTILSALGFPKPANLNRVFNSWGEASYPVKVIDARAVCDTLSLKGKAFQIKEAMTSMEVGEPLIIYGLRADQYSSASERIFQRGLVGLVKSLSKEIGRKGQRVNLLQVERKASLKKDSIPVQFFGTGRSAFITGQVLDLDTSDLVGHLENQVCLVTGGSRGIGAACVARLQKEKARVIILDVPSSKNEASLLLEAGAEFYGCDVTDLASVSSTLATIVGIHGHVDVLVNNAGITRDKTLKKMTEEYWDQLMAVNLQAVLNITDHLLAVEGIAENGRIINMSSISGIAGNFGQTNYTAAKAALIEMASAYADHVSDKGIRINAIAPGFIQTDMVRSMPLMTRIFAERLTCLAQAGTPDDIAEAVTFLAHPGAQGINGQVLRVCGGSFLGA